MYWYLTCDPYTCLNYKPSTYDPYANYTYDYDPYSYDSTPFKTYYGLDIYNGSWGMYNNYVYDPYGNYSYNPEGKYY